MSNPLNDAVATQYERWPYPPPLDNLQGMAIKANLREMARDYWPATGTRDDINVLIAGCGTYAAAAIAHHNPNMRVVGIDVSEASLAHEDRLRKQHGLNNLEL